MGESSARIKGKASLYNNNGQHHKQTRPVDTRPPFFQECQQRIVRTPATPLLVRVAAPVAVATAGPAKPGKSRPCTNIGSLGTDSPSLLFPTTNPRKSQGVPIFENHSEGDKACHNDEHDPARTQADNHTLDQSNYGGSGTADRKNDEVQFRARVVSTTDS